MPPMVRVTTPIMALACRMARMRSMTLEAGPGGPKSGLIRVWMKMDRMNSAVSSSPGKTPARNRRPMDSSVRMA